MNLIWFELEGPLPSQDNAYELMRQFPRGGKTFEVISRYDDLLPLEAGPLYEREIRLFSHSFPGLPRNER